MNMSEERPAIIESMKMFMGRAIATREHIPEFANIYIGINNQGDIMAEAKT